MLPARNFIAASFAIVLTGALAAADKDVAPGLREGTPELRSVGPLAFGPPDILFVADPEGAAIFAIATGEKGGDRARGAIAIEKVDEKIAALLGTGPRRIRIVDLAVSPISGKAYLAVMRGQGANAAPVILRADRSGKLEEFPLEKVRFARVELPNPPAPGAQRRGRSLRGQSVTDMIFRDGRLLVAGLSNEEFASTLRAIPFPFGKVDRGTGVKIYHGAHGKFETRSPVRTFVPFDIEGESYIFAAYTCTPLVRFSVDELKPGGKVQGTTIAELGNRNRPLDMITYRKDDEDFLLIANNSRGIMKLATSGFASAEGITERVERGGTKGVPYETVSDWTGVEQLDRLDDKHALVVRRRVEGGGALDLVTLKLP